MMHTDFAVYIGIVYSYLPFMILPLYSNLEKHDLTLLEAAADLGARPVRSFLRITLPLSMPGIIAGSLLVFIPAVGEFVIPSLLGGSDQLMIGKVLSDEFFANRDWPVASAVAIAMLLLLVVPIMMFQRLPEPRAEGRQAMKRASLFRLTRCASGSRSCTPDHLDDRLFVQQSRLVTVWDAANSPTIKWYGRAVRNDQILGCGLAVDPRRGDDGHRRRDARHARRAGAGALRAVPRPRAALGPDDRAAGDARSHHRPVAAAAVRRRWSSCIGWPAGIAAC
jgi:hypothetical protein